MSVQPNTVVAFHYVISTPDGGQPESSRGGEPTVYLHGARSLFPLLERALAGRAVGDRVEVKLDSLDAYGPRKESLVWQIAVKHLASPDRKLKPGSRALVTNSEDRQTVTVIKVGKYQATVDGNHPFAGKDLVFDIEIAAIRDATPDEIAHGHAHGIDGSGGH